MSPCGTPKCSSKSRSLNTDVRHEDISLTTSSSASLQSPKLASSRLGTLHTTASSHKSKSLRHYCANDPQKGGINRKAVCSLVRRTMWRAPGSSFTFLLQYSSLIHKVNLLTSALIEIDSCDTNCVLFSVSPSKEASVQFSCFVPLPESPRHHFCRPIAKHDWRSKVQILLVCHQYEHL